MRLSKKSRYGLRALVDLSVNSKVDHVSLNSIAERNDISPQYLEQVFASLRRAGIVKSVKGPQGGYLLAYPANKITVLQILEALEGSYELEDEDISEENDYRGISVAIQKLVIEQVNEKLHEILRGVTLEDLENEYIYYNEISQDMYYI
jgi:Rrf2 family protein